MAIEIVSCSIKHGDFPVRCVIFQFALPEGNMFSKHRAGPHVFHGVTGQA